MQANTQHRCLMLCDIEPCGIKYWQQTASRVLPGVPGPGAGSGAPAPLAHLNTREEKKCTRCRV